MFFGCLSMVIHGSISLVRSLPIVQPYSVQKLSLRPTLLLLSLNVFYSGIFALGTKDLYRIRIIIIIIREGFIIFASAKVWNEFIRGVGLEMRKLFSS